MTPPAGSFLSSPSRGIPFAPGVARRGRGVPAIALAAIGWVLLWTFFALAVVAPGARLHASAGPQPVLMASATARS
jgi:hypothetical protein